MPSWRIVGLGWKGFFAGSSRVWAAGPARPQNQHEHRAERRARFAAVRNDPQHQCSPVSLKVGGIVAFGSTGVNGRWCCHEVAGSTEPRELTGSGFRPRTPLTPVYSGAQTERHRCIGECWFRRRFSSWRSRLSRRSPRDARLTARSSSSAALPALRTSCRFRDRSGWSRRVTSAAACRSSTRKRSPQRRCFRWRSRSSGSTATPTRSVRVRSTRVRKRS